MTVTIRDSFVRSIEAECQRLRAERARIDGELTGLETALRLYKPSRASLDERSEDLQTPMNRSVFRLAAREGTIKQFVFDLIAQFPEGMSSSDVLIEAEKQGRKLNRNTITSLLSATASQGGLVFANGRYRIPEGIPGAEVAPGPSENQV